MTDSFKKKEADSGLDWKSVLIEKEHQPAKVKTTITYSQLELQKASQEAQKKQCEDRIAEISAEMAKVKEAAQK